jgi:hypothetical protein
MIDIDFTREDIETIRESLRSTRQSYLNAVDSGIYDSKVIGSLVYAIRKYEALINKIDEWSGDRSFYDT